MPMRRLILILVGTSNNPTYVKNIGMKRTSRNTLRSSMNSLSITLVLSSGSWNSLPLPINRPAK